MSTVQNRHGETILFEPFKDGKKFDKAIFVKADISQLKRNEAVDKAIINNISCKINLKQD